MLFKEHYNSERVTSTTQKYIWAQVLHAQDWEKSKYDIADVSFIPIMLFREILPLMFVAAIDSRSTGHVFLTVQNISMEKQDHFTSSSKKARLAGIGPKPG